MNAHPVKFYGLSTCVPCKYTRELLDDNQVQYDLVYVDKLDGQERNEVIEEVRKFNPQVSFPTLVMDDGNKVIVGFQPEIIKEAIQE